MEYFIGTIKWFSNPKGIGFINPISESNNQDIFIHYSCINMDGFKTLKAGETVKFLLGNGAKGFMATEVIPEPGNASEASTLPDSTTEESTHAREPEMAD